VEDVFVVDDTVGPLEAQPPPEATVAFTSQAGRPCRCGGSGNSALALETSHEPAPRNPFGATA